MNSRSDRGQATVLTLVFLVVLLGMAALVLDIGSWYRADRATQNTADAAALAGAQALPSDPGNANTLALQYMTKNGGGTPTVTLSSKFATNDTVKVNVTRPAHGHLHEAVRRSDGHRRVARDRAREPDGPGEVRRADRRQHPQPEAEGHRNLPLLRQRRT